jgi:hypothetical protein
MNFRKIEESDQIHWKVNIEQKQQGQILVNFYNSNDSSNIDKNQNRAEKNRRVKQNFCSQFYPFFSFFRIEVIDVIDDDWVVEEVVLFVGPMEEDISVICRCYQNFAFNNASLAEFELRSK